MMINIIAQNKFFVQYREYKLIGTDQIQYLLVIIV